MSKPNGSTTTTKGSIEMVDTRQQEAFFCVFCGIGSVTAVGAKRPAGICADCFAGKPIDDRPKSRPKGKEQTLLPRIKSYGLSCFDEGDVITVYLKGAKIGSFPYNGVSERPSAWANVSRCLTKCVTDEAQIRKARRQRGYKKRQEAAKKAFDDGVVEKGEY